MSEVYKVYLIVSVDAVITVSHLNLWNPYEMRSMMSKNDVTKTIPI